MNLATSSSLPAGSSPSRSVWREHVQPKEHGSWSLACEPLVLGLLCTPSPAGAAWALAVVVGFLGRRPLRTAVGEVRVARRRVASRVLLVLAAIALAAGATATDLAGPGWLPWIAPALVAGVIFIGYDLRGEGREEVAEIAGVTAFAWMPAILVVLGGRTAGEAWPLALLMLGRAVPTVIFVRTMVRGRKAGRIVAGSAIGAGLIATAGAAVLAGTGRAPWLGTIALGGLVLMRIGLARRRPCLPARTLGIVEAVAGVIWVATVAWAWSR